MTPEQLLKPRYKVIADYPGTHYKIGEILESSETERFYNKYPHIFNRLEWWEDRSEDQMPEYVKCVKEYGSLPTGVFKTCSSWGDTETWCKIFFLLDADSEEVYGNKTGVPGNEEYFLPATLKEYEAYKNQLTA